MIDVANGSGVAPYDGPIAQRPCATADDEERLIGSMLMRPSSIPGVLKQIGSTDFATPLLRTVFASIAKRYVEAGDDGEALAARVLADIEGDPTVGDPRGLLKSTRLSIGASDTASACAEAVREASMRRQVAEIPKVATAAIEAGHDPSSVLNEMHADCDSLLRSGRTTVGKAPFRKITCSELAAGDYEIEYLIEGTLAKGQPLVIAGPQKSLKTSLIIDVGVSLATGTRMLGRLEVPRPVRVLIMSAESGLATIQETTRRIAASKGRELEGIENLIFSPDVPRFDNPAHAAALRGMMLADGIEVLIIDPAYLAMPGAEAGNLMVQGELLRAMSRVCEEIGVTMVIVHHTKKTSGESYEPLELKDISWSGFPEFARQWWLVSRRERYEEGTGEHRLWLSLGGSAGHSALYAVDVNEGVWRPSEPRWWAVSCSDGVALRSKERAEKRDQKKREREQEAQDQFEEDRMKIWDAMKQMGSPNVLSEIRAIAKLSHPRATAAVNSLQRDGLVCKAMVPRGNGREYPGFGLVDNAQNERSKESLGTTRNPLGNPSVLVAEHTHSDRTPIGGPSPSGCASVSGSESVPPAESRPGDSDWKASPGREA